MSIENWQLEADIHYSHSSDEDLNFTDNCNPFEYQKSSRTQKNGKRKQNNTQKKNSKSFRGKTSNVYYDDSWN